MKPALINAHAQQVLQAVQGAHATHGPLADLAITRSWRRCLDQYQLDPASRRATNVVEHPRLQDHRAPLEHIICAAHWQIGMRWPMYRACCFPNRARHRSSTGCGARG